MCRGVIFTIFIFSRILGQVQYNHPELNWHTFETDHFMVHFHDESEMTAREAATVAEIIYSKVTDLYEYQPPQKTHLVLIDTDDISNGAAYYYDNKIVIWASPLDFELRGSHRWLQNVITHEFVHIVSLQKAMKTGMRFPAAYLQIMSYEHEKRKDVLYGYPNTLISYPVPGTSVPPWLAEGTAQFMYDGADWDHWDTHRDMILRDRAIHDDLLSLTEMNTFGKKGIGNESTYNAGFALSRYIAYKYGSNSLKELMIELSKPLQYSIDRACMNVLGIDGERLFNDFESTLKTRYKTLIKPIELIPVYGDILVEEGTANTNPKWRPNKNSFAYLSNKENDYFGQTDLFIYDIDEKKEKKIAGMVYSSPTWHPSGEIIYFSKKSKFPNRNGSKYYDLYEYHLKDEKEQRITKDARAFSPVYVEKDSSIAYLATFDGYQDVYILDLKSSQIKRLTNFEERPILSGLDYDMVEHRLIFDMTTNHYKDIGALSLSDTSFKMIMNNPLWDERNMTITDDGTLIYADDRSGIYNLYMIDSKDTLQGYVTNVTGGAFMPDIAQDGRILFSSYNEGRYTIALLDSFDYIDQSVVGYSPTYFLKNKKNAPPIVDYDQTRSDRYEDQFPQMFILPKMMLDYGTVKPGFYFYSNEILDRLSLFGGASANNVYDLDLFFLFEFKRFFPTLFFEAFYQTRNTTDRSQYQDIYDIKDDIRFRLIMFRPGLRIPIFGSVLELFGTWQRYRAFIKESLPTEGITAGAAYDYFQGTSLNMNWKLNLIKKRLDGGINPSNGFQILINTDWEKNKFIRGLDFSDSGTLVESFDDNDLLRLRVGAEYHYELPWMERWTLSFKANAGWISNVDVDSFFHFFNGGLPGLKGYPFYSIEGTRTTLGEISFRIPIMREKHKKFGWMIFQNSVIGGIFQFGDAWTNLFSPVWKKSVGIQWRLNGYSFYNFPTAIEFEIHQGLTKFEREIKGELISYGDEPRAYLRILFDF